MLSGDKTCSLRPFRAFQLFFVSFHQYSRLEELGITIAEHAKGSQIGR